MIQGLKPQIVNHLKPSPQEATRSLRSKVDADGDVQMGVGTSLQPVRLSVTSACHYCKEVGHFKNNCLKLAAKRQKKSICMIEEAVTPQQQQEDPTATMACMQDQMNNMQKIFEAQMEALKAENVKLKASTSWSGF